MKGIYKIKCGNGDENCYMDPNGNQYNTVCPKTEATAALGNDPQCYDGTWYEKRVNTFYRSGYIEEYYTSEYCESMILVPGTSLLNQNMLGFFYLVFLGYLFLGISIIADIFMEAIEVITSTTKDV